MADAATCEVSRAQLWVWIKHGAKLNDGRVIDKKLINELIDDELDKINKKFKTWKEESGDKSLDKVSFNDAAKIYTINNFLKPISGICLVLTVLFLFLVQASEVINNPFQILLIAIPLIIQTFLIFFITAIFMIVMMLMTTQRVNLSLQQDSTANLEIFLTGLLTITIMSVGATQIMAGTLDIGLLIGSNILAARALQGANKYAKAKEAIKQRDQATAEIISFIKQ